MRNGEIKVTLPAPVMLGESLVDHFDVDLVNGHGYMINVHYINGVHPKFEDDDFVKVFIDMLHTLEADIPDELSELPFTIWWAEENDQANIKCWTGDDVNTPVYEDNPALHFASLGTDCACARESEYWLALPGAVVTAVHPD